MEKRYRFGQFELDIEAGELYRGGRRIPLQDLPIRLLGELVRHPGELMTRERLRQALWHGDVHVDFDGSLNAAVRRVREALGDSARDSRFIETLPRRGYRLLAPVTVVADPAEDLVRTQPTAQTAPRSTEPGRADTSTLEPSRSSESSGPSRPALRRKLWPAFLAVMALTVWILTARFAPPPSLPAEAQRLAVLPLEAIGDDERLDAIAAGLTDELIVHLGTLAPEHLEIVAPTSVRRAQIGGGDITSIADRLDVRFVVAGTLRLEDDRLRVAARLVRAKSESLMWATSLERRIGSLLDVENELATRLGEGLRRELLDGAPLAAQKFDRGELEPEAYEKFLRARHFLAQQTPDSFASAEHELLEALELAPEFADAWAALATTRAMIGIYDLERPRDVFPRAERALERALTLEPENVDALVARAVIDGAFHWRFEAAGSTLHQVLRQAPQHVEARRWLSLYLQGQGQSQAAQAELELARRLDPLSLVLQSTIGWCHFLAGDLDQAIESTRKILELDADYLVAWDDLKWFYTVAGRQHEAAEAFFKVVELEGDGQAIPRLRQLYAEEGFDGLLEESLTNLQAEAAKSDYKSPYDIAIAAAALDRRAEALDWLERSFEEREVDMLGLRHDPRLDSLRGEERFAALLRRFEESS